MALLRSTFLRSICLVFLFSNLPFLQSQNLGGGISIGFNASQVDGDLYAGFNKAGLVAGGFAYYQLSEKFYIQPEINFEQLGSASNQTGLIVKMNYFSFPVLLRLDLPVKIGESRNDFQFIAGPVPAVLLSAKDIDDVEIVFIDKWDLRGVFGVAYQAGNTHFGLRYGYSLKSMISKSLGIPLLQPGARGLFHNYVSFNLGFHFSSKS